MLNQLFRLLHKFRILNYAENDLKEIAINEHIDIIDALCKRDTTNAKALMKKHIENSKIVALSKLLK